MTRSQKSRYCALVSRLAKLGLTYQQIDTLCRCERALHRWSEHECNGTIQRDERTGKPSYYSATTGQRICATSDREAGALRRIAGICASLGLISYHQTDPRGCALYVGTSDMLKGRDVAESYNHLIAVCY